MHLIAKPHDAASPLGLAVNDLRIRLALESCQRTLRHSLMNLEPLLVTAVNVTVLYITLSRSA